MSPEWVYPIRDKCLKTKSPFFFKQWGTWGEYGVRRNKKDNVKKLDGVEYLNYPVDT